MNYYFDHSGTTQVEQEVIDAMLPYLTEKYGNPSSIHQAGQEAHMALNNARNTFAAILHCHNDEVIFTSCATESTTMALIGFAEKNQHLGKHIITSSYEHSATLKACKYLETKGFEVTYVQPNKDGIVTAEMIEDALKEDTIMVSLIYVHNELGTVNPIGKIGKLLEKKEIFFHTDAVQALNYFTCDVERLHIDALSLSAHKIYGPKGIGLLYLSKKYHIEPLLHGNQEFGLRGGTQNVPYAVGFAKAAELVIAEQEERITNVTALRNYAWERIQKFVPDVALNAPMEDRAPHNLNVSFRGTNGEALAIRLDLEGIALSTGSSCSSQEEGPSTALLAAGISEEDAVASLRISLGYKNTKEEIEYLVEKLAFHVGQMRHMNITY